MEVRIRRIDKPESILVHSDQFLGTEFSDELYHWKYIKREKKNGKWVYTYDKESLTSDIKKVTGYAAKEDMYEAEKALNLKSDRLRWLDDRQERNTVKLTEAKTEYERLEEERKKMSPKVTEASYDVGIATKAYEQAEEALRNKNGGKLKISSLDKSQEMEEFRKATQNLLNARNRMKSTKAEYDKLANRTESLKKKMNARKRLNSQLDDDTAVTKREMMTAKEDYMMSKSIYDKSLAGYIDRGKSLIDNLLERIRKK